ncbi:MAG: hypothetical protein CL610_05920 [Anaerolineaceae bacterium]|nr:hypothetical protein [Anaerolineaceae bacterium]
MEKESPIRVASVVVAAIALIMLVTSYQGGTNSLVNLYGSITVALLAVFLLLFEWSSRKSNKN